MRVIVYNIFAGIIAAQPLASAGGRATLLSKPLHKNPEAAEVVESKLTTYNLKKTVQAPMSITPNSKDIKLEPGDQLLRIYKVP